MTTGASSAGDLRWQCRRGMLELDLLLNGFLDQHCESLDEQSRASFERLLTYPDQTLLDLLLGNMPSSDHEIADLVERIRCSQNH